MAGMRGVLERMEQRERHLSFTEVVAGGFPDFLVGEIIENIILDLEAEAEQAGIFPQCLEALVVNSHSIGAYFHTGYEKRCRLAVDDIEICLFVKLVVSGIVYLVKLSD